MAEFADLGTDEPSALQPETGLAAWMELATEAIWMADPQGRLLEVNAPACALLGYGREELVGRSLTELFPLEERDRRSAPDRKMPGTPIATWTYQHWQGYSMAVEVRQKTLADGYSVAVVRSLSSDAASAAPREQQARRILDSLFSFVGVMTPAGILIEANRAALDAARLQPADVLEKPFTEAYWWSFSVESQTQLQAAIARGARGESVRYDAPVRLGENHFIVIDFAIVPLFDSQGRVEFLIPSGIDITERKRFEIALQKSEAIVRQQLAEIESIYVTAPIGLCFLDPDLRFVRINERLAEINGMPVSEHLGRSLREVLPEMADQLEPLYRQVLNSGQPILNREVRGMNRSQPNVERDWLVSYYPQRGTDGEVRGVNVMVQEITERKRTEAALRDKEQQLRQLSDSLPQFIWMFNAAGEMEYVNRQWVEYAGLTLEQSRDRTLLQAVHHSEDIQHFFEQWAIALETRQPFELESRLRRASDGTYRWFLLRVVPGLNPQGQVLRWFGTSTDIHDRKVTELNDQFLNHLERQLRQLSDAAGMVWETIRSLGVYLNLDSCHWHSVDQERGILNAETSWLRDGTATLLGIRPLSDYCTPGPLTRLSAGQTWSVSDVTTHPDTASLHPNFLRLGTAAFVSVPCIQQGHWVASLAVCSAQPRHWQHHEVVLLQETVARLWSIIEQMRAMQALSESQERYRTLFESVDQGFCICEILLDPQGNPCDYRFLEINPAFERMTGLQQAIGKTVHELIPNLESFWVETYGQVALTGVPAQFENYSEVMNRWFDVQAFRVGKPERHRFGLLFTNITERKQAEAAMQERSDHLRILYETTRDLLRTDRPLDLVEPLFARLQPLMQLDVYLNYRLDEDQHLHLNRYGGISEQAAGVVSLLDSHCAICVAVAEQRSPIAAFDLQHSNDPDSQLMRSLGLTAYACQPLVAQGNLFGTLGFGSRRRTQFSSAEAQLLQAICDQIAIALERAELLASLQQQTTELRQVNRLKDEFLAALSHELRTPLNPILGWTQMLKAQKLPPTKTLEALNTIERNARQQIALVNDLLDVSSVIRGKLTLQFQPLDLVQTVKAAIATVHFAAQAKGIAIQVLSHAEAREGLSARLPVMGDGDRLQQVFWNLLSNAIKFTPERGRVAVELSVVMNANHAACAQVCIRDSGIGIAPEFLPHVFEHFRQADGSSTRKYGGLGLGLSIVRHLVELHGGTVTAASAGVGQGSTFTVQLPLSTRLQAGLLETANPEQRGDRSTSDALPPYPTPLTGRRILLVDDDPDNLDLLRFLLEQQGAVVMAVSSAQAALQILSENFPDLIVSDIGMPEMSGYELIRQIRSMPRGESVPALAFTAFAQSEEQAAALLAGFQAHLSKPVDPLQLLEVLTQLVQSPSQ